ncbi:MAG: AmmeMemoRadiSam system protein B [Planctomycetota bacterium]
MVDARDAGDAPQHPRLRPLEVRRHVEAGCPGVVVTDPLGLAPGTCFIPETLLPIVGRFDGERSVADVEREVRARGHAVPDGFVGDLVRQLDEALLLASPRAAAAERAACDAFLAGHDGARPARHAGSAGYPSDAAALRARLATMVPPPTARDLPAPRGLVAPHIDLQRGAAGYRAAYGHLGRSEPADLYVIFGTGHKGPAAPVTGLALDWHTPLGRARTDRAFVAAVEARLGPAHPRDALLHRDEHSLEFQVLLLQHTLAGHDLTVAGFLCGELPAEDGDPSQEDYVIELIDAFDAAADGRRVCYVAGADLAHRGPFFGADPAVDHDALRRLAHDDRARLQHLTQGDAGAFHRSVVADGNSDRVCGATPMFLCAALAKGPGELLHYGQAAAPDGTQVVSFCSMVFAS